MCSEVRDYFYFHSTWPRFIKIFIYHNNIGNNQQDQFHSKLIQTSYQLTPKQEQKPNYLKETNNCKIIYTYNELNIIYNNINCIKSFND